MMTTGIFLILTQYREFHGPTASLSIHLTLLEHSLLSLHNGNKGSGNRIDKLIVTCCLCKVTCRINHVSNHWFLYQHQHTPWSIPFRTILYPQPPSNGISAQDMYSVLHHAHQLHPDTDIHNREIRFRPLPSCQPTSIMADRCYIASIVLSILR